MSPPLRAGMRISRVPRLGRTPTLTPAASRTAAYRYPSTWFSVKLAVPMVMPPLLEPPPEPAEPWPSREVMPPEQAARAGTEAAAKRPPRSVRRFIESP